MFNHVSALRVAEIFREKFKVEKEIFKLDAYIREDVARQLDELKEKDIYLRTTFTYNFLPPMNENDLRISSFDLEKELASTS